MSRPIRHGKGWRIRWTDEKGNRQSEVHTTFDDAKFSLARNQAEAQEAKRGLRELVPKKFLFNDLCNYYLSHFSVEKRRKRDDESVVRAHLRPFFGNMNLDEVGEAVDQFKVKRAHLNKKTLHNHITLLISMLRVAHEKNWLSKVPRIRKPKIRLFEKDFHYLRSDKEIHRFLSAAKMHCERTYVLYATAVYTGMRAGEIAGLRWSDVNFEKRLISVQRSYHGPTKNGEIRYVPILNIILPLLRAWRLKCPGDIVFPNDSGRMYGESSQVFQEIFHKTLDRAGFPRVERNGKKRRYIVFHDLRHSFASHWVMRGGDIFKLQKILGHKSVQMTMRYAHLAPDAYSSDYDRFGPPKVLSAEKKGATL